MNVKNLLVVLLVVPSLLFGARLTIYNETTSQSNGGDALVVQLRGKNNTIVSSNIIKPGKIMTFNTHLLSAFSSLEWRIAGDNAFEKKYAGRKFPMFKLNIESPRAMLNGSVNLYSDVRYAKNFTKNKSGLPSAATLMKLNQAGKNPYVGTAEQE